MLFSFKYKVLQQFFCMEFSDFLHLLLLVIFFTTFLLKNRYHFGIGKTTNLSKTIYIFLSQLLGSSLETIQTSNKTVMLFEINIRICFSLFLCDPDCFISSRLSHKRSSTTFEMLKYDARHPILLHITIIGQNHVYIIWK